LSFFIQFCYKITRPMKFLIFSLNSVRRACCVETTLGREEKTQKKNPNFFFLQRCPFFFFSVAPSSSSCSTLSLSALRSLLTSLPTSLYRRRRRRTKESAQDERHPWPTESISPLHLLHPQQHHHHRRMITWDSQEFRESLESNESSRELIFVHTRHG